MQGTIIVENDNIRIDHWRDERQVSSRIAFTFMERQQVPDNYAATLGGTGFGGDLLLRHGFEVVCFKPTQGDWYQRVTAADLDRVNTYLAGLGRDRMPRVGYGSSMGAYATIQFAAPLGLDRVLSLSPLVDFSGWDSRFSGDLAGVKLRWTIEPATVARRCVHYCVYDPYNDDRWHMASLATMLPASALVPVALPCSGHPAMFFLAQTGLLGDTCLRVLRDGVAPDTAQLFRRRRNSWHWHFTLAQMCLARRKYRFGLRAIDAGIEREPRMPHMHLVRVRLLARSGQAGAAVAAARRTLDTLTADAWMIDELTQFARRDKHKPEPRPATGGARRPPALNPAAAVYRPVPPPAPP